MAVPEENHFYNNYLDEAIKEAQRARALNDVSYPLAEFGGMPWRYDYTDAQFLAYALEELKRSGVSIPNEVSVLVVGGIEGMPLSRLPHLHVVACDPIFALMPPIPPDYPFYTEIHLPLHDKTVGAITEHAQKHIPGFQGFDVVTSRFVIDYIYRTQGETATTDFINNSYRMLRQGGISLQNWGGVEEILLPENVIQTSLSYLAIQKQ